MTSKEALKRIRQETAPATYMADFDKNECCKIIEKDLDILEVLKTKEVDINFFKTLIPFNKTLKELQRAYNLCFIKEARLTLNETKLIKEWLDNDK